MTNAGSEVNPLRDMLLRDCFLVDDVVGNNIIREIISTEVPRTIDIKQLAWADDFRNNLMDNKRAMKIFLRRATNNIGRSGQEDRDNTNRDRGLIDDDNVFAIVGDVENGSPGYLAGLRKDDKLIQFGQLSASNFNNIHELETVSQASIFKPLSIKLKRGTEVITLEVTPRPWEKDGLVGCEFKIYPVQLQD